MTEFDNAVAAIEGPIAVVGATGFVGANLVVALRQRRGDVTALARAAGSWRLDAAPVGAVEITPRRSDVIAALSAHRPRTIINLAAHGAYSSQEDAETILDTNFRLVRDIAEWAAGNDAALVQAGSSSEFGWNCEGPGEDAPLHPNSMYAVTKAAASQWLSHLARAGDLDCCTLRIYSAYGPLEDATRLFPALVRSGMDGRLPPFADPATTRDFVYVDDVVDAFVRAASLVRDGARGLEIAICSGHATSMRDVARLASAEFGIDAEPEFGALTRAWDLPRWFGDPAQARRALGWSATTTVADGLHRMREWYDAPGRRAFLTPPARVGGPVASPASGLSMPPGERSAERPVISGVVACYRDGDAMPYMYERFKATMEGLGLTFELIFANDASPDDAQRVLEELSARDPRVRGVTHSRNFGSQSAFLSGMRIARGDYVVLMDGDLQDPPELIPEMWAKAQDGFDVVYGHRVDRDAPWFMRFAYKAFYRAFNRLAPFKIPRDAGDFSLMSRAVVNVLITMPERDLFIRAQRAYLGFRQAGVDYKRPERMFGKSTNNLGRNLGWATRGVLAVSRAPLTGLSIFALGLFAVAALLILVQVLLRIFVPGIAPQGLTSVSILIVGLGALNLLAIAIVGEYVGRILEESKRRPRYVAQSITIDGVTTRLDDWDGSERA